MAFEGGESLIVRGRHYMMDGAESWAKRIILDQSAEAFIGSKIALSNTEQSPN